MFFEWSLQSRYSVLPSSLTEYAHPLLLPMAHCPPLGEPMIAAYTVLGSQLSLPKLSQAPCHMLRHAVLYATFTGFPSSMPHFALFPTHHPLWLSPCSWKICS